MQVEATVFYELADLRRDLAAMTAERDLYRRALARVVGHMPSRDLRGAMSDSDYDMIDPASRFESYAS